MRGGRREALGALSALAALAALPFAARAQARAALPRVGLLASGQPGGASPNAPLIEGFRRTLREHGHVEGENVAYEPRYGYGKLATLREAAAELVRLPVAVIVAFGPGPTAAARAATSTIPIVMGNHDAVEQGIVKSLARPTGNVTGWSISSEEMAAKQLEMMRLAVPRLSRIAILTNPESDGNRARVAAVEGVGLAQGLKVQVLDVTRVEAIEPAFAAAARAGADAMLVLAEPILIDEQRPLVIALAARHRLPAAYLWRSYVDLGGLMSYGPNLPALLKRSAYLTDRILRGAKPAELPIERPLEYELVVNLKAAEALGLRLPQGLLLRATDVIR